MEREPQSHQFPWQEDAEGSFVKFSNGQETYIMRPSNTVMYLYPDLPNADHIFVYLYEADGVSFGLRLFREAVDRLGEGAFTALVEQMFEHGYDVAPEDEPEPSDYKAYEDFFGRPLERPISSSVLDSVIQEAMANFEAESEYYLGHEWT